MYPKTDTLMHSSKRDVCLDRSSVLRSCTKLKIPVFVSFKTRNWSMSWGCGFSKHPPEERYRAEVSGDTKYRKALGIL